jgi:hypothetical protein
MIPPEESRIQPELDRPLAVRFFMDPESRGSKSSARPEGHPISTGIGTSREYPVRDMSDFQTSSNLTSWAFVGWNGDLPIRREGSRSSIQCAGNLPDQAH